MNRKMEGIRNRFGALALLSALAMIFGLMVPTLGSMGPEAPKLPESAADEKIEDDLRRIFETEGEAEFLVLFSDEADTSAAFGMSDWEERGRFVYETLTRHAEKTQAEVISDLDAMDADYESYWIVNSLLVTGTATTASTLAAHSEVESIVHATDFRIPLPEEAEPVNRVQATEWGLDAINIPQVWDQYGVTGEDIVVGVIDTGAQWDHPALINSYRGNDDGDVDHDYNWYDPSRTCGDPSPEPCDQDGHGTSVTGTVTGDDGGANQIGVAPGAKWISAMGCDLGEDCSFDALFGAGQWMAAPTDTDGNNPDPDMRPHILNNSWGGQVAGDWYLEMINNWIAFGMFPQFASGNNDGCGAAASPGHYAQSYSAGAFDINGNLYFGSARGPSDFDGGIKPNISAPGVAVRSSVPGGGYDSKTGTSMASPHVAGTVAVLWSAAPALIGDIEGTKAILNQTAIDTENLACGGEPGNNNVWGEGKLDALAAIEALPDDPPPTTTTTTTPPATSSTTTTPPTTSTTEAPTSTTVPPTTEPEPGEHIGFDDVPDDHLFHDDIIWLAEEGITYGCNPPKNTLFCPSESVTRGQMAAFLTRTFDL
ncbi:MAG: S8 family serine peptidase, partial [Acidimicrobiia bacterium]|nr:S8 family serine peptidase [Acidimicrobiia bacterium]